MFSKSMNIASFLSSLIQCLSCSCVAHRRRCSGRAPAPPPAALIIGGARGRTNLYPGPDTGKIHRSVTRAYRGGARLMAMNTFRRWLVAVGVGGALAAMAVMGITQAGKGVDSRGGAHAPAITW